MASPTHVLEVIHNEIVPESVNTEAIREAVEAIVVSAPFRTTRQCQNLLRYVVEKTLVGEEETLRERIIGVEVFGRLSTYDTSQDPVVRIRAADVRRRLAQFYQSEAGQASAVRIDIPSGSYRPTFEMVRVVTSTYPAARRQPPAPSQTDPEAGPIQFTPASTPVAGASPDDPQKHAIEQKTYGRTRLFTWVTSGLLLVTAVAALSSKLFRHSGERSFDKFWAPVVRGSRPVLICMGSNVVYQLSHEFMLKYLEEQHISDDNVEKFVDFPAKAVIPASEVHRAKDSFVALGDVAAASRLVATLAQQGHAFQERFPPDISFAELQNNPTILIGGFNNQLTLALTKNLRFVLSQNSRVLDRQNPEKKWVVQFYGDARETEDYAVVSRILNSETGSPVLTVAGIGQYGTQAAAEFVSSPAMIEQLAKTAPKDWYSRNMQVVLHVKVIDFRPVSTDVVGQYFW